MPLKAVHRWACGTHETSMWRPWADNHPRCRLYGDTDELARVWVEGWNDAHAQILPHELARFRTLSYLRARLAGSLADTSVAASDGRPVGFAMVKKDELDQLYVRGKLVVPVLPPLCCPTHWTGLGGQGTAAPGSPRDRKPSRGKVLS